MRVRHVNKPEMEGGWNIVAKKRSRGLFCSVKELNGVVTSSCKSFQRFVAACSYSKRLQKEVRAIYTHTQCSKQIYITQCRPFSQRCTAFTKDWNVKGERQILRDSHDNHLWLTIWVLYSFLSLSTRIVGSSPNSSKPSPFVFFVFTCDCKTPSYRPGLFLSSPIKCLLTEIRNPENGKP